MSSITEAETEALLTKGLRNRWFAICPSHFVAHQPVSLRRCGFKMVFWRDLDGKVHALEDHCPHRGAPLSLGMPLGDRIACSYHGVQVDKDGVAVLVPGSPGCKLEGAKATTSFATAERAGMIFAYVGDKLHPEPPELVLPEELTSDEFSHFLCYAEWQGDYRYVIDNVMDPMHGTFLHKQSHSMAFGDTVADFRIRNTEIGFVFEKEGQRNVNFDWTEWGETGVHWLRLEIPYPKTGGPGGNFHIIGMYTPITDTISAVVHWRCRRISDWQRDTWRFLYKNRLEARHWRVLEQDRELLAHYEADARNREILYAHDAGLVRGRRVMRAQAIAQLEALKAPAKVADGV
jgi:phenylpropionate dioxygenase-like ring-hydroxylating dioxygenase large terminal subunit